jgi:hypothetical protein
VSQDLEQIEMRNKKAKINVKKVMGEIKKRR